MLSSDDVTRVERAAATCRARGLTQLQIADALGASQSQVSRVLAGRALRTSRLLKEVCSYVERFEHGVTAEAVRANPDLVDAVTAAWDGSTSHARALAVVIRSLSVLKTPEQKPK